MAYSELTQKGKEFITTVCNNNKNIILSGKNRYKFPYSVEPYSTKTWTCHIKMANGSQMTNAKDVATALIQWFNKYSKIYELDANIIAAQAYIESGYKMWNYAEGSTASGIPQFVMETFYDRFVKHIKTAPDSTDSSIAKMTKSEIETIIDGLEKKDILESYQVGCSTPDVALSNRPIFHQNVINNPEIMIKAQCDYMNYITKQCNDMASTTLFCYNRGPAYTSKIYSDAIVKCKQDNPGSNYYVQGLNYVLETYGVLGDKNNLLVSKGARDGYKPKGIYFGYDDEFFPGVQSKNLRLNEVFNAFGANVNNSVQYNTSGDVVYPQDYLISNYMNYRQAISYDAATSSSDRKKQNNSPNNTELANLINLANKIYDPLYAKFGKLEITTAFRGEYLNGPKISGISNVRGGVGGDKDSQHRLGQAMDIKGIKSSNSEIFYYIANNLDFDQMIWEEGDACNPGWIHVSLVIGNNRKKLTLYNPNNNNPYQHNKTIAEFNALKDKMYGKCNK